MTGILRADSPSSGEPMARSNHSVTGELWAFQRKRKKGWLGPIILVLVLAQGSAVAPFIYTIF